MEETVMGPDFEADASRICNEEWEVYWPDIDKQLDTIPQYWELYWTKDYIRHAVLSGVWQAWGFGTRDETNVIVLTQIIDYPANRFLQVMLAFGNSLDSLVPLIDAVMERFAVETKCKYFECYGREGWAKKFDRLVRVGGVFRCKVPDMGVQ